MERTLAEDILFDLVELPTATNNRPANEQALEYIGTFLGERGMYLDYRDHDGFRSLVATTQPTQTPEVMLVAHADVVPAPPDSFRVREADGKLYGRGVWDMKSVIAAYMEATDHRRGELHRYDYGIQIVTDEETRNQSVERLLSDGFVPRAAVLPDGGDNWQLEAVAKGAWTTRVRVEGRSAHGSRPWEGDSATFRLLDILGEVRTLFDGQGPDTDTLNISLLEGGEAINQIPRHAEAGVDIRLMSAASQEAIEYRVLDIYRRYGATWEVTAFMPALAHDLRNPYLVGFADSVRAITGVNNTGCVSYGASDAAQYVRRNIPCAVTRPPGGGHHSENEWIDKRGFLQLAPVIGHYIDRVCRIDG